MGYELQRLTERHRAIISLTLRGFSRDQVARAMGMTAQTISHIVNTQLVQNEVARRQASIEEHENESIANNLNMARGVIAREALPSVLKLAEIRDQAADEHVRLSAAKSILQAAFGKEGSVGAATPVQQVININAEKVAWLQTIAKEAGLEADLGGGSDNGSGPSGTSGQSGRNGDSASLGQEEPVLSR